MPLEEAGAHGYTGTVVSSEDRYMSVLVTGAAGFLRPACGREAVKIFEEMQPGDVKETYAGIETPRRDLGFEPRITIDEGLPRFVQWYRDYHGV